MLTAICLTISIIAADPAVEPVPLRFDRPPVGVVPRVTPPAPNLPASRKAPRDGRWVESSGMEMRAGTFLPYPLDVDVLRRMRALDGYPDRCQDEIEYVKGMAALRSDRELGIRDAEHVINQVEAQVDVEEQPDWDWYRYAAVGVLTALGGLGVGALIWR